MFRCEAYRMPAGYSKWDRPRTEDPGRQSIDVLTNIGAAGVEQVLVHHGHAILGERTEQS